MGNLTAKVNRTKMRTNDGSTVPTGKAAAMDAGKLNVDTSFSNTTVFERDRKGGMPQSGKIEGMHSWQPRVNLDDPGFDANGNCFYKFGVPFGEKAMFNQLPPGPDINDQAYLLINEMKLRVYSGGVTYPGDTPWPVKDVEE